MVDAWVYGIARYTFIDYLRARKRTAELENEDLIVDTRCNPETHSVNSVIVARCLDQLDELDRNCLLLHDRSLIVSR